jgi:DNA-binding GntR family transcriptional regulator
MIQTETGLFEPVAEAPPRFQTAEEHAYKYLRDLILAGRLPGGTRLNQDEMAKRLQMSRMPVRQAVLRLESEGLVVNRPNRGAVVTTLGPAAMLELFEMRSVLEGLAFSLALPNIDARGGAELAQRLEALEHAQQNASRWIQLHDEFHMQLCHYARRPRLSAQIRRLHQSVTPYLRLYLSTDKAWEMPGSEHRGLLDAISRRDPEGAERMMREHIMSAAHGVVEFVRRYDEAPRSPVTEE